MRTLEEKYDAIKAALDKIELNKIIVLTGDNASGKSLLRKVLWATLEQMVNDGRDPRKYIWETSMERRTSQISALGALSGVFRDNDVTATSANSIRNIVNLTECINGERAERDFNYQLREQKQFLVFDEPEVGCGEEVQLGMAEYINKNAEYFRTNALGLLIITHSRHIVKNVNSDLFINMEGRTKEEWLNRELVPKDIIELEKENNDFFVFIRDHLQYKHEI